MPYDSPDKKEAITLNQNDTGMRERINTYWSLRADEFGAARYREYLDDRADEWRALLRRFLPQTALDHGPVRALDLGCGAGLFTFMLHDLGCEVTGVDYSQDMLKNAQLNAEKLGMDGITFTRMDAQSLELDDGSIDFVFTRNVTWTLPDPARAYAEIVRVLAPGGVLVNVDANYGACFRQMDAAGVTERLARDGDGTYAHPAQSLAMLRERNDIADALYVSDQERPLWDLRVLMGLGMEQFTVDLDIMAHAFAPRDSAQAKMSPPTGSDETQDAQLAADAYRAGRIFLLAATKPMSD